MTYDRTDYSIEIFHGQLTPNLAHIYARVSALPGGGPWTLAGRVRGPECAFSKTLPTTTLFADSGRGATLLAKATLTEPCFWSADLPFLYHVTIELRHHGRPEFKYEQQFGMRFLGRSDRYFYWANKRWVLRGAHQDSVTDSPLSAWRDEATAMIVEEPPENLCLETSRQGVILVAKLRRTGDVLVKLRRLAAWPSVAIVLVEAPTDVTAAYQVVVPNLLLGMADYKSTDNVPEWSQAVLIHSENLATATQNTSQRPIALIACRRLAGTRSLSAARSACDLLQRDVVQLGDFAGYVV